MNKFILLSGEDCAPCKLVKKRIADSDVKVTCYDVTDPEAQPYLQRYPIRSVPTLIVDNQVFSSSADILERLGL